MGHVHGQLEQLRSGLQGCVGWRKPSACHCSGTQARRELFHRGCHRNSRGTSRKTQLHRYMSSLRQPATCQYSTEQSETHGQHQSPVSSGKEHVHCKSASVWVSHTTKHSADWWKQCHLPHTFTQPTLSPSLYVITVTVIPKENNTIINK